MRSAIGRPEADQKRHLAPLPVAVYVLKAGLAQPGELGFDRGQDVGWVFKAHRVADGFVEGHVQGLSRRRDMLEVAEDPARLEELVVRHARDPLPVLRQALEEALDGFVRGVPYADDRTLLVLRRALS